MSWEDHWFARVAVSRTHANIAKPNEAVLLGDSNQEMFGWAYVGRARVINAGLGGARCVNIADNANTLIANAEARVALIGGMTNNLIDGNANISTDLGRIITYAENNGALPYVMATPPLYGMDSSDIAVWNQINDNAAAVCAARGVRFDRRFADWLADDTGNAREGTMQFDGVHFAYDTFDRYYRFIDNCLTYLRGSIHD